ncbi:hypothetical protein FD723_40700 (plasmid) [Nostoc sp. C052]|uniref:hypothetical protein n=1 Tax=Nostoc sp. C052 TaxID=2576902 RepID=UPI0015C303B9|nr:hypothetical protein [Nostoc sp. C052]QLE46535.1 hypothetical protein FD723_40700 [Nostoc sp. C052]
MTLKQTIIEQYKTDFGDNVVSAKAIKALKDSIDSLLKQEGHRCFNFLKTVDPRIVYDSLEYRVWEVAESKIIVPALKAKIFNGNAEIYETTFFNTEIAANKELVKVVLSSEEIQFLGFKLEFFQQQVEGYLYLSPVHSLSSKAGTATFCIKRHWSGNMTIGVLKYIYFSAQDIVCKDCGYFFGEYLGKKYLACTVHPSGPNFGYDGCTDKK